MVTRPTPHSSRSAHSILSALLATALLQFTTYAAAICLPPVPAPPLLQPNGSVLVEWACPDLGADTIRVANGPYTQTVQFGTDFPRQRLASRITPSPGQRILHEVRAYVIAKAGVSLTEWEANAHLEWSVHADSLDQPAVTVESSMSWDLTGEASLRGGGYFSGVLDHWRNESDTTPFWVVAEWPGDAAEVVTLGAHGGYVQVTTLVGFGDPATWINVPEPAPLVEFIMLPVSDPPSLPKPSNVLTIPDDFVVERTITQGPSAGQVDLSTLPADGPSWFVDSNVFVGQGIAYSVGSVCGSDTVWAERVDTLEIDAPFTLAFSPQALEGYYPPLAGEELALTIHNDGTEPLDLSLQDADDQPDTGLGKWPDGALLVSPTAATATAGNDVQFTITPNGALPPGDFNGLLRLRASQVSAGLTRNWAIPLILHSDQTTDVNDTADPAVRSTEAGWVLTASPNPFGDNLMLQIIPKWTAGDSRSTAEWAGERLSAGEIVVYDIMGRTRFQHPIAGDELRSLATGTVVGISVPETNGWPSGIYLCQVRLGTERRVIKLVRIH